MVDKSEKFVQPAIPRFDGYYDFWSMTMENFLRSRELWSLVEDGIPTMAVGTSPASEMQRKSVEEAKLKDLKVKNFLFQSIDREILETILDKSSSKVIWESMRKKYQGSTKVKRAQLQALRREFELLAMKEGEKVDVFLGRTLAVVNKMKTNGESMEQSTIVSKILRSLTPRFNYVVCSIEESNDLSTLSIDELHGSLLVHEGRLNGPVQEEHALKVSQDEKPSRGRGRGSFRGGRGRGRGRSGVNRAIVECYKCHKLGHFQYECPEWEKKANYAELEEEEELLLMAYVEEQQASREEVWFLDSGCSNHMTGSKEWFSDLEEGINRTVKLGNDTRMSVVGKGSVKVQISGITQVIPDVYYVPELKNNLLSLGQLQERGLAILIRDGTCKVYHPSKGAIMETNMSGNRMFFLLATKSQKNSLCLQAEDVSEKEMNLWHCRFGHLNQEALKLLSQKEMVIGLPNLKPTKEICAVCMVGKQHRASMSKKSSWRASRQLQLIHSDICGPITPISHSGKRYILTFIDDFTRKTWAYFLHEKSEAFLTFKIFKASVEKEIGMSITCLRTDRGGEFTSNEFGEFCKTHGITRQLTAAFTPQQNGVAERKNRTIMNAVRSMLSERQVPKAFWSEATNWSVHIQNRSPTAAVEETTPEEAWSGKKPVVEYFRVFGCIGHVHIPDQRRRKLDDKSKKCVFLGVSEESKAWRLYDPITKTIVISKDVVFDESKSWDWSQAGVEEKALDCGDEEDQNAEEGGDDAIHETPASSSSNGNSTPQSPVSSTPSPVSSPRSTEREAETRARRRPAYLADYDTGEGDEGEENLSVMLLMMMTESDPVRFDEAVKDGVWREAMKREIESIEKNNTWELTTLPEGFTPIGVKWVYKTKLNEDGEVDKYKARLVAKGYAQCYGIDYTEVFAPVARLDTIRTIIAVAAQSNWEIFQLDVKSAFLHGELKEDVYVRQPEGFIKNGEEEKVYKLRKALYGLKQAPRAWYSRIEGYFLKEEFERCSSEHTLFTKVKGGNILIVSLYVDDLIFTGNNIAMCDEFKKSMMLEFEMSDLGKMKHFLGVEVKQSSAGFFICQKRYAREVLARFGMEECNAVRNPIVPGTKLTKDEGGEKVDETMFKQLVGSLMYLTVTRPDLMYGVCLISRFMANPKMSHWLAAKRILRYLKGTIELGILYRKGESSSPKLIAFTDSDYAGDLDDRRSTTGCVFLMASGAISWASKKQPVVALSTTEAEYIAAAFCACQCVWLRRVLETIGAGEKSATVIQCDNSSTIQLSKHPVLHGKSKHIEVRFHYLRELVNGETVKLEYCATENQVADIFTKPLKLEQFEKLRAMLGMVSLSEVS
ncbi:Zinc finger CCHC-type superfamily [Arabidopsis suecica]|uniref:Zinc finger CCHC-type superfamily n=1 Tax=Arabidopsis suecica TaxID=45249 RepID=A0A8T2CGS2_ARASU|nr:Zinc finger CCHC-type superfamily [Arabidopsis suecica]